VGRWQAFPEHEQYGVPSPGPWAGAEGRMPGWDWTPPEGARPRLDRVPWWVRLWCAVPFIDRYAHVWMWWHGGWDVDAPSAGHGPDSSGTREPRRPRPRPPRSGVAMTP
jgi:hypothetical protein